MPIADNYIGAKKIFNLPKDLDDDFESNPLPIVITIESLPKYDLKLEKEWIPSPHKKDTIFKYNGNENDISPTLKYSLKNFLLSIAVRNIRIGSNKHNSMLVNITNFNNTQSQIVSNIREEVQHLIEGLKGNFISMVSEFEEIWNNDFVKNTKIMNNLIKSNELNINEPNGFKIHSWDEIRNELVKNVTNKKIEVHPVYGDNRDVLQYDEDYKDVGLNVIAVGAIKLSRGLVIKDLTISYFKRPAKQYDTLLQMGRWFGYRPRYLDVCRLFLDEELLNWFEKSAIGSEKLKDRLDNMINLGKTPRDWGLYVRTFADTKMLIPTARNKMLTSAEYDLNGIEATKPTTTKFDLNSEVIENNLKAFTQLIKLCGNPLKSIDKKIKEQSNSYLFKNINYQPILEFIKQYNSPSMERNLIKSLLIEFIKKSIEKNKIIKWDVFVKGSEEAKNFEKINNYNFSLLQRTPFTGRSAEQELRKGFHYTEEMKENGRKKKNFNDKNILEEKNIRIKNFFHIGNVTDKDLRFLVDDEEYQLAYEKSKEKAKKNNSELPKVASESDIRGSMKSTKGYLCFYLFNPSKGGEDLFNKLYKDKNKTAIGFALHFPGGINLNIKARINKKMQEELGLLDYSDEYYKIEEDE